MKNDRKETHDSGRREFLRGSAKAGAGVAVAAAVPGAVALASDETVTVDIEQKGYRLTNHILEYYKSTVD